jgi:hypothetical protein
VSVASRPTPLREALLALAAVGVWRHVVANYDTDPLDQRYSLRWDAMPLAERSWLAANGEQAPHHRSRPARSRWAAWPSSLPPAATRRRCPSHNRRSSRSHTSRRTVENAAPAAGRATE